VHVAHRFDGNYRFYDAILADHSNMDLSIRGNRLLEDGSPINIPIGENSAWITCDGEQNWLPVHTRRVNAIMRITQWSVIGDMHYRTLADFETVMGLRSSRVAFCFSFRHSWKTVAQIS